MAKLIGMLMLLLTMSGCSMIILPTPAQFREIAKIKDSSGLCIKAHNMMYGDLIIAWAVANKDAVVRMEISKECGVNFLSTGGK